MPVIVPRSKSEITQGRQRRTRVTSEDENWEEGTDYIQESREESIDVRVNMAILFIQQPDPRDAGTQ